MELVAWTLVLASLAPAPPRKAEAALSGLVVQVVSADYRGDRHALARLDVALGEIDAPALAEYRDYWRGFARWRRAINGFSETPTPGDLAADLEQAVVRFRAALERRPGWIEPRLALVGCWGNLMFLAREDPDRIKALAADLVPAYRALESDGGDNSRALWILGGMQAFAPPPWGGDVARATATMRRGLDAARREADAARSGPAWIPAWGGPENLMNLAYLYAHGPQPDRDAALAYAEGALLAVPEWHYVRDVLMPQIERMPRTGEPPAASK